MSAAGALTTLGGRNEFRGLETFPAPPHVQRVTMTSDEVTALCPITGQPDWYVVSVDYAPRSLCLESKTLKLYLHTFRQHGEFVEALASRMATDIGDVLRPHRITVTITQKARGGIAIVAVAAKEYVE